MCTSEAVLYSDCGYQLVAGKVKKKTESSFQNVKHMRALGIHVPQGCKATLYNEKRHFAAHITGPKNYCSTGQLDGIDIVGLQDVADVALVAGELAKAEDTIKELSKDMKLMKQNITSEMHRALSDTRDGLLRKIKQIELTPGPTGPRGLRGLSVTGATGAAGPRGLRGFTGATGMKGNRGVRGVAGERGIRGREGKVGPRGDKGTSVQGPRGEQGPPGLGLKYTQLSSSTKDFQRESMSFQGLVQIQRTIPCILQKSILVRTGNFLFKTWIADTGLNSLHPAEKMAKTECQFERERGDQIRAKRAIKAIGARRAIKANRVKRAKRR